MSRMCCLQFFLFGYCSDFDEPVTHKVSHTTGAGDIEAGTPLLEPEKTHAAAPKKKKVKLSLLDPAVMAKADSDAQAEQCIQELSDKLGMTKEEVKRFFCFRRAVLEA